ncbi:MAG: hypothetical protein JO164_03610 [Candidatus Eremiobacteraeota bacterium]|nr:hypothetical protein [Candidatus Eremiobacteraeota bacterium]
MRLHMRFSVPLALAAFLFASTTSLAVAAPPTSLDVTAKSVDFFSDRFIVTADGDVSVRLSDGTVIRGQTFTMDLKLNRYLVAGDVHLDGPTVHEVGAAFAGYPDLDRSYFLPASGTPSRVTYFGLDWAHPDPKREQPGDAYYFPDLTGARAYIKADGARIVPRTNILFDMARVYTAGVYMPTPRYVVTFSANSHYFENAFAGARGDVGVPFNGSAHSLTALHLRNDAINGTYLAFDQHFVWDQDWVVLGVDPLTQEQRQYNLIGYKRWSPKFESRLFTQVSAAQAGIINAATNAAGFAQLQLSAGLKGSNLTLTQDNYYQYLLGLPYGLTDLNTPQTNFDPRWKEHPTDGSLAFTGRKTPLTHGANPLYLRPRFGVGYAHDVWGEGGYPNEQPGPPTLWYRYAGGSVYTPPIRLGASLSLTGSYDRQRTWFSLPHQIDNGDLRFTLAGQRERQHLRYYLAYEVKTIDDYWGAQQLAAYPAATDVATTAFGTYSGQAAFRGLATSRGYTSSLVYTPTQYFEFAITGSRFYDTPAPVPGLYGQPPWQVTGDLRVRLSRQVLLDLTRQYYFNFANERWTPQFGIQFSP